MGVRRQAREWALQFLFQRDFSRDDLATELADFWEDKNPSPRARSFTEELIHGVEERREQIDEWIGRFAANWDVKRMGGVDRNAMRIALFEMTSTLDVPPIVSIDEAVELAKVYSSNQSARFVNGILDRARSELGCDAKKEALKAAREAK